LYFSFDLYIQKPFVVAVFRFFRFPDGQFGYGRICLILMLRFGEKKLQQLDFPALKKYICNSSLKLLIKKGRGKWPDEALATIPDREYFTEDGANSIHT